jgi:hypothetical protein
MVRFLASWFGEMVICLFPKSEYEKFKQIVIFGKKKKVAILDEAAVRDLMAVTGYTGYVDTMTLTPGCVRYDVPVSVVPDKLFHFRNLEVTPEEMLMEADEDGFDREMFAVVARRNGAMKIRPAAPLRKGHLAILVAAGMTDGLVEKDGKRMLIKGSVRKEKVKTVETDENVEIVTERDVLKIEIRGLDLKTGELFSIQ